jgi:hypothetical protein
MNSSSWRASLFTPQILCFAMLMSTFVYGGLILSGMLPRGTEDDLRWVFAGLGLAGGIASFVIPGIMRKKMPRIDAETREEIDPEGQSMFRDAAPTRKIVVNPKQVRGTYLAHRFTPFVMALALSEIPAIMGLVTWMSTSVPIASCLVLVAFGSTLIVLRFPFRKRWRADAEALVGAEIPD